MLRVEFPVLRVVASLFDRARWVVLVCATLLTTMLLPIESAHANVSQCKNLSRQLASLSGGNSSNFRKYDRAAKRQASELNRAKRQYRAKKCNFLSGGQCRVLGGTIRKMEGNFRSLSRKRDQYAGGTSSKKRAIKARIAALRCGKKKTTVAKRKKSNTKRVVLRRGEPRVKITVPQSILGGYRTMCVRTCDGYYFPVSHASKEVDFARDERICNALCPASESKLFVYRNGEQESEEMVSLSGVNYTALPTAFKYRTQARSRSCSCGVADPSVAGLSTGSKAQKITVKKEDPFLKSLPAPLFRPDIYADTETQANDSANMTANVIKQFVGAVSVGDILVSTNDRKVRVVGAEFLPDPAEAIDLRAQVPTSVQ